MQSQIISQYIETNSGTKPKGIEIWNNTGAILDFAANNLVIKKGVNGGVPSADYTLNTGTLTSGSVIVIGTTGNNTGTGGGTASLDLTTAANGSFFYNKGFNFNGDDSLEVWYGTTKTDVFGIPGVDPGTQWVGFGVSTKNQNIRLKPGITTGTLAGFTDPSTRFETVSIDPNNDDSGFGISPDISIWAGTTSTDWNTAGNWSNGIPTSSSTVSITGSANPVISAATTAISNMTIDVGSSLTITGGGYLTVSGNLTNNGAFIINSGASNSGSLIVNGTSAGNVTYNRHLTSGSITYWHLIAAPIGAQSINSFVTNAANNIATSGVNYSVTPYDNTVAAGSGNWKHWTSDATNPVSSAGNFVAGKGYEILTTADGPVNFTGTVATSLVSIPITIGGTGNPWNLIGNPFPSSIFANVNADATNNFITVNSGAMDPSFVGYYYWDPTLATPAYVLVNLSTTGAVYIAPGQAFFVKSVALGATINFTTAMRTNQPTVVFQKAAATNTPTITLKADNGSIIKTTDIKYIAGATLGLDPGYDAGLFNGTSSNFKLYTHLVQQDNSVDFMLQALPDNVYDTTVIPVGLDALSGTQVIFKADITNLPIGKKVYLEDRLLGNFNELNNIDKFYTLTLTADTNGIGRFYLRTLDNLGTLAVNDYTKLNFSVIAEPKANNIRVIGNIEAPSKLDIYDTLGRLIKSLNLNAATNQNVKVSNMTKGVYFVKVQSPKASFNTKIAWY